MHGKCMHQISELYTKTHNFYIIMYNSTMLKSVQIVMKRKVVSYRKTQDVSDMSKEISKLILTNHAYKSIEI